MHTRTCTQAVGSSLDARVLIHCAEPGLAATLQSLQAAGNAVDELKYLFIVSQVRFRRAVMSSERPGFL
jgi:hypothetical protein